MRKRNLIILTLLVLPIVLLSFCHFIENPQIKFSDYREMEQSSVYKAGWIPPYIPKSAHTIWETHNLDTNLVKMRFHYQPGDTSALESNYQKIEYKDYTAFYCNDKNQSGEIRLFKNGKGTYESSWPGATK